MAGGGHPREQPPPDIRTPSARADGTDSRFALDKAVGSKVIV